MTKRLSLITLLTFIFGILFGIFLPQYCEDIAFIGTIYMNLLKFMIVPVLVTAIIGALITNKTNLKGITFKTIVIFIIMFIVSFLLCCGLWFLLKPGSNFIFNELPWEGELATINLGDFLISLFPTNIIAAMSSNQILPTIIFAFIFGIIGKMLAEKNESDYNYLVSLNKSLTYIFQKMLSYIMYLTPIGVFALMANTAATFGTKIIGATTLYIGCAYLGCAIVAILVMIVPVWIICKVNPLSYLKKAYKIWLVTLSTCSSAATLPNTIKVCNEDFGIDDTITQLVVPLGCTIHMCGGAVSFSLLAMLNMQMYNIPITFNILIIMLIVALLLNMGAPGIPGGGIVIGAMYLSILNLPLSFIGFYAGIYRLLDMAYTTMNVTGDITANLIINKMYINEKNK